MSNVKLNRILSKPITAVLLKTPVTPNQITFFNLALGILVGFCFSKGHYVWSLAGAVIFQIITVLDNCDGEIARAKNLKSEFGGWLDILVDMINDVVFFSGIAVGLWKHMNHHTVLLFGTLGVSGSILSSSIVILEKLKGFGPAVFNQSSPEGVRRENIFFTVFNAIREGEITWFVLCFALAAKIDWFLVVGGVYMQVIWISAFALNFKWIFSKRKFA